MPVIQHLVSPKLPTVLANHTCVDLPGHDIYPSFVTFVYVIPTELNISKFEDALSRVLQLCPHAAGQLQCTDGRWFIGLINTAVPVDVYYAAPGMSSGSFLNAEWVIQRNLSPLLPVGANGVGANDNVPLLRFKMTFFDHETCIGVSWHHSLGDGNMLWRFMHMLSQFYQDLPYQHAALTFEKYHFPAPSPDMVAKLSSCMPLYRFDNFDEAVHFESKGDPAQVRWRFSRHELEELRLALGIDKQDKKSLSKQDCLTAYLVAILNLHRSDPVQTVRTVTSYRHIRASFVPQNVAGNLVLVVPAGVPDDMAGVASAIRHAVTQSRDPDVLYMLESLQSEHKLKAASAGTPYPPSFRGDLFVNAILIDWWSAHFGCPDGTRFHPDGVYPDSLRCFKSNPIKGKDGIWKTPESIEISLGVSAELKPKVMETLARGIRYMLDKEHSHSRL